MSLSLRIAKIGTTLLLLASTETFPSSALAQGKDDQALRKNICALLRKKPSTPVRATAASTDEIRKHLLSLNPWLSPAQLEAKIKSCDSPFMLLRSFVSSFYDLIAKGLPGHSERFASLQPNQGWIMGDAHPENFGALLNDQGKAVFTMNDLDDFSRGPLYLDILRFLSAVRIYDEKIDPSPLLKAYRDGLKSKDWSNSKTIEKLLTKSEAKGLTVDPKIPDDAETLTSAELKQVATWVEAQLGTEFTLKDAYRRNRDHGGSGGLERLELLLNTKDAKGKASSTGQGVPVELKELTTPATFPIQTGAMPTQESRIQQGLNITLGKDASHLFRVVEFNGKKMLMRPRWDGNIKVQLDDLNKDKVGDVLADEAYRLGMLHRLSSDDIDGYAKAFSQMADNVFVDESGRVTDFFKQIFVELKADPSK